MIRRLLEAHYFLHREKPKAAQIRFWFRELLTPQLLVELAGSHSSLCRRLVRYRPLLAQALPGKVNELERALREEEQTERERNRLYWLPLRKELEKLRHVR